MPNVITLTTDFGEGSPYVAQMKGAILTTEPAAVIVDITHAISPQNVRQAALVLDNVCDRFPPGTIHVAVVDPGVGTSRRLIYCRAGERVLLGPDNGLFSRIAQRTKLSSIISLEDSRLWLPTISATFHGRDILAPVAARLCQGLDAGQLGPPVDQLIALDWPEPIVDAASVQGEFIAVDSFGNAVTNISAKHMTRLPTATAVHVLCADPPIAAPLVKTYGQRPAGTPVALVGSSGLLEVAIVNGNAARELGLSIGDHVEVRSDNG